MTAPTGQDLMREYGIEEEPMADLLEWVFEHFPQGTGQREAVTRYLIEHFRHHFDDDFWFAASVHLFIGPEILEKGLFAA